MDLGTRLRPEVAEQLPQGQAVYVADRLQSQALESRRRLGADSAQDRKRHRIEKGTDLLPEHCRQSFGLVNVRGQLGDEPIGPYAHGGGKIDGLADLLLGSPADEFRRANQPLQAGDIQKGLVDGDLLDPRGHGLQNRHDLPSDARIAFHAATDIDGVRR
jgi:hypothetical protein